MVYNGVQPMGSAPWLHVPVAETGFSIISTWRVSGFLCDNGQSVDLREEAENWSDQ